MHARTRTQLGLIQLTDFFEHLTNMEQLIDVRLKQIPWLTSAAYLNWINMATNDR